MIKFTLAAAFGLIASAATAADVELWRLDCGTIHLQDVGMFSDSFAYAPAPKTLTNSCYLIRNGDEYMLWDTGLSTDLLGQEIDTSAPTSVSLKADLITQLAAIGVTPEMIGRIGISHGHFDHTGQAAIFPQATLMIGKADFAAMEEAPLPFGFDPASLAHWRSGNGTVEPVVSDKDIFGDGNVTMLSMPGHTNGETALLVRLAQTGAVLLSGDVVHFREQIAERGVPPFNVNRAESLASMARMEEIAANLNATLVIQHDADDIAKLPSFPDGAR